MTFASSLSPEELLRFHRVVTRALEVRSHFDAFVWLQGDMQSYLPHDILIAAWGDFDKGTIQHDIISALAGVRSQSSNPAAITPLLLRLFQRWTELGGKPFDQPAGNSGFVLEDAVQKCALGDALQKMQCTLVHGIHDLRGSHDCLYVAFGTGEHFNESEHEVMALALPYIDIALRQIKHLPQQAHPQLDAHGLPMDDLLHRHGLSGREEQILQWVALGKTNTEIGDVLKISEFTVKNHLQRIFKKMGAGNRAQAVGLFKTWVNHA